MRNKSWINRHRILLSWIMLVVLCIPSFAVVEVITKPGESGSATLPPQDVTMLASTSMPEAVLPEGYVSPVPEVSPEASVSSVPEVSPEASISPVPEVSPEASISPVPEVLPEASVSPVPEVLPEASVSPIPEATPIPSSDNAVFWPSYEELSAYISTLNERQRVLPIVCLNMDGNELSGAPREIDMGNLSETVPTIEGYSYMHALVRDKQVVFLCLKNERLYFIPKGELETNCFADYQLLQEPIRLIYAQISNDSTTAPGIGQTVPPETPGPDSQPLDESFVGATVQTIKGYVNLRDKPSTSSTLIKQVEEGRRFSVLGTVTTEGQLWYAVQSKGRTLYIRGDLVQLLEMVENATPTLEPSPSVEPTPTLEAVPSLVLDDFGTRISLTCEAGTLMGEAELVVAPADAEQARHALSELLYAEGKFIQRIMAYDISLLGTQIVDGGSVKLFLPIPLDYAGEIAVWHMGADGLAARVLGTREGDVYTFETTHLGWFALASVVGVDERMPPDPMTVDFLREVMRFDTPRVSTLSLDAETWNTRTTASVGVSCYNQAGEAPLTGDTVPTTLSLGDVHTQRTETFDLNGKHYEFVSAMVGSNECTFFGEYQGELYFSTNGNTAVKLNNQPVQLIYREYYMVTLNENQADWGILTAQGKEINTSATVRVYAGQTFIWSVEPGKNESAKIRYRVSNIATDSAEPLGNYEYDKSAYSWNLTGDTNIGITYANDGHYRVFFDKSNLMFSNQDHDATDPNLIKIPADNYFSVGAGGVSANTYFTFYVYVKEGMKLESLTMNGAELMLPGSMPTVTNRRTDAACNPTTDTKINYNVGINCYLPTHINDDVIKVDGATYAYKITVRDQTGDLRGIHEDLYFIPRYAVDDGARVTLRLYTDNIENGAGMVAGHWENPNIALAQSGNTYQMDNPSTSRSRVHIYFVKAKPGYRFVSANYSESDLGTGSATGPIASMDPNWDYTDYKNQDPTTAQAAAIAAGYTHYISVAGRTVALSGNDFTTSIYVESEPTYITYDGNGNGGVVENVPAQTYGSYKVGSFHLMQLAQDNGAGGATVTPPTRAGYAFKGWQLKSAPGTLYQPGDKFDITTDNFALATGTGTFEGTQVDHVFEFEAVWEAVVPQHTYKVYHRMRNAKTGSTDNILGIETCTTPAGTQTVFAKPSESMLQKYPGCAFNPDDPDNVLEAITTDTVPFTGVLTVMYKEKTVTLAYESSDEAMGTVSPTSETRFYYSGENFQGSTAAEPKWGSVFEGWWCVGEFSGNKDSYPATDNRVTTNPTVITADIEAWVGMTYPAKFIAHFKRSYTPANLTIGKTVIGDFVDATQPFMFTLTAMPSEDWTGTPLSPEAEFSVSGVEGVTKIQFNAQNQTTLQLKHGQQAVISGLPVGWQYTVQETVPKDHTVAIAVNGTNVENVTDASVTVTLKESGDVISFTNDSGTDTRTAYVVYTNDTEGPTENPSDYIYSPPGSLIEMYGSTVLAAAPVAPLAAPPDGGGGTPDTTPDTTPWKVFKGWRLKNDPNSTLYQPGDMFTLLPENWPYAVEYSSDGATGILGCFQYEFIPVWEDTREAFIAYTEWEDGQTYYDSQLIYPIDRPATKMHGSVTLKAAPAPSGSGVFIGWKLKQDPSGKLYQPGDTFTLLPENWAYAYYFTGGDNGTGIIADPKYQYEFLPVYRPATATLFIPKQVTGAFADVDRPFTFTLTAHLPADETINTAQEFWVYIYPEAGSDRYFDANGQMTLTLKHGQEARIFDLPTHWSYTVEEAADANYAPFYQIGTADAVAGAKADVTLTGDTTVAFTNRCTITPPPTGIQGGQASWKPMLILTGLIGVLYLLCRHRFRKQKHV